MTGQAKDEAREERIHMEIIVDAHNSEEQAVGWYYYLDDTSHFPFSARCVAHRTTSPLKSGDKVEVVAMAPGEECEHDMLVLIWRKPRQLAVPLMQLEGILVSLLHISLVQFFLSLPWLTTCPSGPPTPGASEQQA